MGAGLDTFIPTIPEVRESDIKANFPHQTLTVIDGRPMYEKMLNCERELGINALAVEVPFGDGNRGCLGLIYSAAKYLAEAGVAWDVPESEGVHPIFAAHATENDKKRTISAHIKREKGIKIAKCCERLLRPRPIDPCICVPVEGLGGGGGVGGGWNMERHPLVWNRKIPPQVLLIVGPQKGPRWSF